MSRAIRPSLPFLAVLACVVVLVTVSCNSKPKFIYTGTWRGNRNLTLPDTPPDIAVSAGKIELIITDSRFQLSEAGIPSEGAVVTAGDHAVLHITHTFQRPLAPGVTYPEIKLTPQEDGSLLFDNPAASDGKPVGLNKVKD